MTNIGAVPFGAGQSFLIVSNNFGLPNTPETANLDYRFEPATPGVGLQWDVSNLITNGVENFLRANFQLFAAEILPIKQAGVSANGDAVYVRHDNGNLLFAVIDGLGHGPVAAEASQAAVVKLEAASLERPVLATMHELHQGLRHTRGAAATLCVIRGKELEACAVGNVQLSCVPSSVPLVLSPGVLGHHVPKFRVCNCHLKPGTRLALATDGISSRFRLEPFIVTLAGLQAARGLALVVSDNQYINISYGVTPIEQRERYREAHDLIVKAWTSREVFPWNGKYFQLPFVNLWPRPIQQPHPPIWVPGAGSTSTYHYAAQHDYCYCFLSYFGYKSAAHSVNKYWEVCQKEGRDLNPYRLGFLQLVGVSETDEQAERDYAKHVEYFYHKLLHIPLEWFGVPGHQDYQSLANAVRNPIIGQVFASLKERSYKDFLKEGFVICGSPGTVRDRLKDLCDSLRVGNLMVLLHMGSMSHELTLKNIELFFNQVAAPLRNKWDDEWENRWWPASLRKAAVEGASA